MSMDLEMEYIAGLQSGSVKAFNALYQKYHVAVYANIFKMVKKPEFAEDLLQEVFLSLWQNKAKLRTDTSVGGWLFVVSYNKSASFLKKKIKESLEYVSDLSVLNAAEPETGIDEVAYQQQFSILEAAITSLSPRKQEVFRLCRLEGYSIDEVATMLGLSSESVKDYLKLSTKFIKGYIAANYRSAIGIGVLMMVIHH